MFKSRFFKAWYFNARFWRSAAGAVISDVVQMDMHDGVDHSKLERSRVELEQKVKHERDDLTRIVRKAFQKVTGEPEPQAQPVTSAIKRRIARATIAAIKLEGLGDAQVKMAEAIRLVREYEQAVMTRRRNDDDALTLLLLAA